MYIADFPNQNGQVLAHGLQGLKMASCCTSPHRRSSPVAPKALKNLLALSFCPKAFVVQSMILLYARPLHRHPMEQPGAVERTPLSSCAEFAPIASWRMWYQLSCTNDGAESVALGWFRGSGNVPGSAVAPPSVALHYLVIAPICKSCLVYLHFWTIWQFAGWLTISTRWSMN